MTVISSILLASSLMLAAQGTSAPVQTAQAGDSATVISAPATPVDSLPVMSAPAAPRQNSGLPQRAPVAQNMAAYWPVFAAFVVLWLGIVAYTLSFGKRSEKLARELERMDAEARNTSA